MGEEAALLLPPTAMDGRWEIDDDGRNGASLIPLAALLPPPPPALWVLPTLPTLWVLPTVRMPP